ncbi:MAG: hypothetical protein EAZ89_08145 [Bacteroidetes bacterium]|nr:MAG: hypothetical protein EAZ89_08145 [Bacteroidota bacterium]
MINYDSKNWIAAIRHFKSSYVIRRTVRMCFGMGLYAAAISTADYFLRNHPELAQWEMQIAIEPSVFGLLGIFLSLLLVFRTNTSYDRWWDGRKQWGALINQTRGLAILLHGMLGKDSENRRFFAEAISSYCLALSEHLRGKEDHSLIAHYSGEYIDDLKHYTHVPNRIVRDLYERSQSLYRDGLIDGYQISMLQPGFQALLDIQGACERIRATPIPFAHNFFIKLFILAYCVLLPLVLVPIVGFYSILLTMFVSYALIGLEYISVEIEEPFGMDCNDLPTHNLAVKIEHNVHEILEVSRSDREEEIQKAYIVIH